MKQNKKDEYAAFQSKVMGRFCGNAAMSVFVVIGMYQFLWKGRIGGWIVRLLEKLLHDRHEAFAIYHHYFRGNREIFFIVAVVSVDYEIFRGNKCGH